MRLPDDADTPLRIHVEVTVGIDGRVIGARLTDESNPLADLVGPSALNTARMWRFRPATLGGQPIQSTMALTLRYNRPR
jgi:TonB family protein